LFICLRPAEPVIRTRGSFGATMSQMVGAGAQVTCGGPGAAPGQRVGVGAAGARGGPGAAPSREAGARAAGTRESPGAAPSSGGRSHCLDLMLVHGGTRSSGCRQRPPGPPWERLQTRRWCQFFDARSVILSFYSAVDGTPTINIKMSTAGPREVPELKVRQHPPPT
jgi:hypothetical protein